MGWQRVGHNWATKHSTANHLREEKIRRWHYPQEKGVGAIVKHIQRNVGNRGRIWRTLNGDGFKENFQRGALFDWRDK